MDIGGVDLVHFRLFYIGFNDDVWHANCSNDTNIKPFLKKNRLLKIPTLLMIPEN